MTRISGLTGATLEKAPSVCHECIWWQTRNARSTDKRKWIREAEEKWGAWGTVYHDDDGRLLGSMQYGPAELFPRARELPAGPASEDAVLVTCGEAGSRARQSARGVHARAGAATSLGEARTVPGNAEGEDLVLRVPRTQLVRDVALGPHDHRRA